MAVIRRFKWFGLLLCCIFPVYFYAQTLQEPPGIRWKKIDTAHFEVVFPETIIGEGQRVANTLEHLYDILAKTLNRKHDHITVLLTNQSVVANGYVSLAPWMAEFYNTPVVSSELGVNEWYNLLAVHEGRHMVQFEKTNQGFTKFMGLLFGEFGRLAFSMLSVPIWYWEGDAVGMETVLTNGGRGRQPAFDLHIRTLLLSGVKYPYAKAYLGSFKDWYPSWYHLGYLLTTYGRREYGSKMWSRVLDAASRKSYTPFSFSNALKKETGKRIGGFYQAAMDDLLLKWQEQLKTIQPTPVHTVNKKERHGWTTYMFPQYHADGSIIVQKYGLDDPLLLVQIFPNGKERILRQILPLQSTMNRTSLVGDRLIWNEYYRDIRWGKRSYSSLVLYDIKKGETRRLTHKTHYFDPALSPDGKLIATVEYNPSRKCSLVILDIESGQEIKRFHNPGNDLIWFPSWSPDGERLVMICQNNSGRALTLLTYSTGKQKNIIPPCWQNITFPTFYNHFILYNSPYSGIDNIYAVDYETGAQFQVTSSKFGSIIPALSTDGLKLAFNHYTAMGYDVAEMPLKPEKWVPIEHVQPNSIAYYQPLIAQEQGGNVLDSEDIPQVKYPVQNYYPHKHLMNIHSWEWLPLIPDLAFNLVSTDKFNLFTFRIGPTYNINEKVFGAELHGVYSGLLPIIDFSLGHGGRSSSFKDNFGKTVNYGWRESFARLRISLPMDFSRGVYRTTLSIGAHIGLTRVSGQEYMELYDNSNGNFLPIGYFFRFSRSQISARRDIRARFGQSLTISYQHTPWNSKYKGSLFSASGRLYFPGIFRHHSLLLTGAYENQNPDNYHFSSRILYPRGYDRQHFDSIYKLSMDYALPVVYPDMGVNGLLYIKRLRLNLFYDYAHGRRNYLKQDFHSVGADLIFDMHFLDIPQMIEMGPRFIFCIEEREFRFEWLLFGVSF